MAENVWPFQCDICQKKQYVPSYGEFACEQCKQSYVYDEAYKIELTPEQVKLLQQKPKEEKSNNQGGVMDKPEALKNIEIDKDGGLYNDFPYVSWNAGGEYISLDNEHYTTEDLEWLINHVKKARGE